MKINRAKVKVTIELSYPEVHLLLFLLNSSKNSKRIMFEKENYLNKLEINDLLGSTTSLYNAFINAPAIKQLVKLIDIVKPK